MALEQVFDCPRRIRELRSGPLGGYVDEFCDWLVESGFRRWTVRKHVSNVSHLGRYLDGQTSTDWETISSQDIDGFFQTYPSICRNRNSLEKHVGSVRWSVNRFIQFLSPKGLFTDSREEPIYQPLLDGYLQWMRQYQDVSDGTLKVRRHSITEHFFLDYAQKNGRSARRSMQSALRTFFRFCLHQGYIQQPLDRAVPTLRTYKLATVPRGLTDSQAEQVLCGIDRQTDVGKRNYAILQLLDTYGVRGGQVRALRLEDIDWAAKTWQRHLSAFDPGSWRESVGLSSKRSTGLLLP
jgi:site-specific recombinase XerD